MRRTGPRRQPDSAGNITKHVPEPAPLPAAAPEAAPARPQEERPETPKRVGWGWRFAIFLWAASFVFLFLYEILSSIFRGGQK
jgi:hypothetical protein